MSQVEEHKAIYNRLSNLDFRFSRTGISKNRRRALWSALDEDPFLQEFLKDPSVPTTTRNRLTKDIMACRSLRETCFKLGDDWCASSIYEAMLVFFFFTIEGDEFVFRGHLDADWRLIPSFFRREQQLNPMLYAHSIYGGFRYAEKCVGKPLELTPFQAEAAAQHYGSGTALLDVTESFRTAAYFATTPLQASVEQAEYGEIFVLSVEELARIGRFVLRGHDLPSELIRVHATKGAFISGWGYDMSKTGTTVRTVGDIVNWLNHALHNSTTVDEMGLGIEMAFRTNNFNETAVIRFRQTGHQFEDAVWGVGHTHLGYL